MVARIPYTVTVPEYYAVASEVATIEYLRTSWLPGGGRAGSASRPERDRTARGQCAAELVRKRASIGNRYLRIFLLRVVEDSHFDIHHRASGCSTSSSNASSVLRLASSLTHIRTLAESLHQNRCEAVSEQTAYDRGWAIINVEWTQIKSKLNCKG